MTISRWLCSAEPKIMQNQVHRRIQTVNMKTKFVLCFNLIFNFSIFRLAKRDFCQKKNAVHTTKYAHSIKYSFENTFVIEICIEHNFFKLKYFHRKRRTPGTHKPTSPFSERKRSVRKLNRPCKI